MFDIRRISCLTGRGLRLALCYAFALQVFAAGLMTASALGPASGLATIICHAAGDGSAPADTGMPSSTACALCAVAASAATLVAPVLAGPQQHEIAAAHLPPVGAVRVAPPAIRTGLARAPPHHFA